MSSSSNSSSFDLSDLADHANGGFGFGERLRCLEFSELSSVVVVCSSGGNSSGSSSSSR